ncbi:hypothetical protein SPRG_01463 [Saprolegnia parasitica CBS 223.65]|uniref:Mitochondrial carrier protein n=1 Tax=Saprolegnia parasitica (strain CBS 223.65) TaxID=695850 RepID=A0A067CUZ8_SAPPC|nr:hypothetical protein SPRG_01463 [Saprolegnia parasitica CBS 223.65]KDO34328.1 hypothetical protein SPRG_01463 [Saprolegnia parasitica CBS 223.65]|eukprot:XP_012195065.1 hypothetical protein SPRG_01463 [Saprolegnia parasitica CBS 223.65]
MTEATSTSLFQMTQQTKDELARLGTAAAVSCTLATALFPLDMLKTHQQSHRVAAPKTFLRLVTTPGLLRGLSPALAGLVSAAAIAVGSEHFQKQAATTENDAVPSVDNMQFTTAVMVLGCLANEVVMAPTDVVKQRLQLGHYAGPVDCVRSVFRHEGLRGFFRSLPTGLALTSSYTVIVAATALAVADYMPSFLEEEDKVFAVVACSSIAASALTTPFDVIRTRLQTQTLSTVPITKQPFALQYKWFWDTARQIHAKDGARGFLRGILPRVGSNVPFMVLSVAIHMALQEK